MSAKSLLLFSFFPLLSFCFSPRSMLGRVARVSVQQGVTRQNHLFPRLTTSTSLFMSSEARKTGVSSPEELRALVKSAGDKLLVIDARNEDASVEAGDQKSLTVAPLPSEGVRPQAMNLIWDRASNSMPLPDVPKDTPIITHCGGGGRGQKAKDFLEKNGFTNVLNGGGPKETDCWAEFGSN